MNLTQPPFDDVHVRRAMNWVMDKARARPGLGRPDLGDIANHIVPDSLLGDLLADYAPYRTPGRPRQRREGEGGDEGLEVRTDSNGMCGAKECKNVLLIADARAVDPKMVPVI